MEGPTYVTLSAQIALQHELSVTANNVANASTAGFKADRQMFESLLTPLDTPGQTVAFVQDRSTYMDRAAGPMQTTDNPLDVAVNGDGYMSVQSPGGPLYTRDGRLQISPDRTLVNGSGRPVLDPNGQTIEIPDGAGALHIAGDGTVSVRVDGASQQVGQIALFRPNNPAGLQKTGGGLLSGGMQPVDPSDTTTRLVQGAIEGSTVQPVKELANMTELGRAYERLQQLISDDNDRERSMIEQLGKTS